MEDTPLIDQEVKVDIFTNATDDSWATCCGEYEEQVIISATVLLTGRSLGLQTQTERYATKVLTPSLSNHEGGENPRMTRNCSRLKGPKETKCHAKL